MSMSNQVNLVAGLDIGNGYVKGNISSDGTQYLVDIPAVAARMPRPNMLPTDDSSAGETVSTDWFNNLDVTFNTRVVSDNYRRLIGNRALSADGSLEDFRVEGHQVKTEQNLSRVLTLGLLAGAGLKSYVDSHNSVPRNLDISAVVALALPIDDYLKYGDHYRDIYENHTHTMTINNFLTPVVVNITFKGVITIAEGASALYALRGVGTDLLGPVADKLRDENPEVFADITAADLASAENIVGVDIGEGTVNLPVFTSGKFNADASRSHPQGYGNVLEGALESMHDAGIDMYSSRKELSEFLRSEPTKLQRSRYNTVKSYVDEVAKFFADEVAQKFASVMYAVGGITEIVYIYGGGAAPLKQWLEAAITSEIKSVTGGNDIPVVYLDDDYSRNLNREGLAVAAGGLAQMSQGDNE